MIHGAHIMIFSNDEQADRAFLRDVLGLSWIDGGGGWLIFKLPPAELGVHDGPNDTHQLYLMCEDMQAFLAAMAARNVEAGAVETKGWGISTNVKLPGGGTLGVYEPHHQRP